MQRTCVICKEDCSQLSTSDKCGIFCGGGHFVCNNTRNDCITNYIKSNVCPQIHKLKDSICSIPCPCLLTELKCTHHCDDLAVFLEMSTDCDRLYYFNTVESVFFELKPSAFGLKVSTCVNLFLESVVLKCNNVLKNCQVPVDPQPDACSAVMCLSCGAYYCNCCFQCFVGDDTDSSSSQAHKHVVVHHPNFAPSSANVRSPLPVPDAFIPKEIVQKCQLEYQIDKLRKCFSLQLLELRNLTADERAFQSRCVKFAFVMCYKSIMALCEGIQLNNENAWTNAETAIYVMRNIWERVKQDVVSAVADSRYQQPPANRDSKNDLAMQPSNQRLGEQMLNSIRTNNIVALCQLLSSVKSEVTASVIDHIDSTRTGYTLLMYAAITKQFDMVKLLVDNGADILNARSHTAHSEFAYCNDRNGLYMLIEHGDKQLLVYCVEKYCHSKAGKSASELKKYYFKCGNDILSASSIGYKSIHVAERYLCFFALSK